MIAENGLIQALDYILNHSDTASIEVLAQAIARRQRDISLFNAAGGIPDPDKMAKDITGKIDASIYAGLGGMKDTIREMIVRIAKEHAPELSDSQINELCDSWIPASEKKNQFSPDILLSMIEQFIAFSGGEMNEAVDRNLREEMGAWPQRYWNAFPAAVKRIITDYLKNKITEKEFKSKILLALGL